MKHRAVAILLALLVPTVSSCTTVRQLRPAASVAVDAPAERTRSDDALDYSVARTIQAPPAAVWAVLVDGPAYTKWNSTVVRLDGAIAAGQRIALVSKVAPDRTFNLAVSTFEAPTQMVWEDGNGMFLGVRTFTLIPGPDGTTTTFVMSETFSGGMLGMIEGELPDFRKTFDAFAGDLKTAVEAANPSAAPAPAPVPETPPAPAAVP